MADVKALSEATKKAVERVLSQQKGDNKKWDTAAHACGLANLSEEIYKGAESDGEARKAFMKELQAEPWTYASNMKKRLAEAGLISKTAEVDEYQ